MLRAHYSDDEKTTFQKMRYNYPDERIMRRFEILWLHACGKFAPEIAAIVQQHVRTVREVLKMYQNSGIELVSTIDSNHPTSELAKHKTSIIEEFKLRPPATSKEAAARIEKLTGIKRSEHRVRIFLKSIGMKFRKTAALPAKVDLEKQEEFKKKC